MAKQPRLFDPGPRAPDPWQHHPDKWTQRPDIVYHASHEAELPRRDRGTSAQVDYGGGEGMHFGSKLAAYERATSSSRRDYIHTARLNAEQFTPEAAVGGGYVVRGSKVASRQAWSDDEANYGNSADKAVAEGKAVPYRNDYEAVGDMSYRVRSEGVRTWSEDVRTQTNAHPALKHLAKIGYNPTLEPHKMVNHAEEYYRAVGQSREPVQQHLWEAELVTRGKTRAAGTEDEMFAKMKTAPVGTGVVRLNVTQGDVGWQEKVKKANPRMVRPTKEQY